MDNQEQPNQPLNTPPSTEVPQPAQPNIDRQTPPIQPPVSPPQPTQPPTAPITPVQPIVATGPQISPKPEKRKNGIVSFIVTILVALLLTQIINLFFFQSYRVFGSSMLPTMHDGDRLIVSKVGKTTAKLTNKTFEPKRGEIIVFTSPKDSQLQLIKRVIGLPGERVVVKNGEITVYNDENPAGFNPDQDGEYADDLPPASGQTNVTVPEGHLFVSGDNRAGNNSLDSRNELGTVPEELIVGTASVRLWPLQNARFF